MAFEKDKRGQAGIEAMARKRASRRSAQDALQGVIDSESSTDAQKVAAARALLLDTRPKRKKQSTNPKPSDAITGEDIARQRERLRAEPGEEYRLLAERRGDENFVEDFRWRCERSLYFFAKFCGIAKDLSPKLHREVCAWLQTWPEPGAAEERIKLLMMPTEHLKTSMASHAMPLHMVLQPAEHNLYFPGMLGRDIRVAMIGESSDKAEENLGFVRTQMEENQWIRGLWPQCVWQDVSKAPKWSSRFVSVPRESIKGEPTFTALGVGTKLYQRHYDAIIGDDLIGWDAAGSKELMKDVNEWRKGLLTRVANPMTAIILFIGTHFTPNDIYVSMKSELPKTAVVSRSVVENGEPLWPERFPMSIIEQRKRGLGAKLFSHLMMNLPTAEGFTGFDWNFVRLFEFASEVRGPDAVLTFVEQELDEEIKAIYADPVARLVSRWKKGEKLSSLYPGGNAREFVDPYDDRNREVLGRMGFEELGRVKELSFLAGKYGARGEETDFVKNQGERPAGAGTESVVLERPRTTLVRRAPAQ